MKKIKHFDGAIMTNDGTNGDKVLMYFNAKKISFYLMEYLSTL